MKMQLKEFLIHNFEDSGWIECDNITTIIGNNKNNKKILEYLLLINNFFENENSHGLVEKQYHIDNKIDISVRYKIPDSIKKEISKVINLDKKYVEDLIEINMSFLEGDSKYNIGNFIKRKELLDSILDKWIGENKNKLNQKVLNIAKKYKKDILTIKILLNDVIDKKTKRFFSEINDLKITEKEKLIIKKLENKISHSYDKYAHDIKNIMIHSMPKMILCENDESNGNVLINKESLSLDNFFIRIKDGFYEKEAKGIVLLLHNFERNCILSDDLDCIDYYREKFNNLQVIHTTVSPFILNERNKDKWILNSNKRFNKETCDRPSQSFRIFEISMGIGLFIWIMYTYLSSKKALHTIDTTYLKKDWIMYIKQLIQEISKNQFCLLIISLVLIVIFSLLKNKIAHIIKTPKTEEIFAGVLTGSMIAPMVITRLLLIILFVIIILMCSLFLPFFISFKIFPYLAKSFISFFIFLLNFIKSLGFEIGISKLLLSRDELNLYIILIITLALLPYVNEIVVKSLNFFFGFIDKSIAETITKLIRRIVNVTSIRVCIYIIAFMLSIISFIFEFNNTLYIKVIKESVLSFILFDMLSNSIYNHVINLNKIKTNSRRLEFLNLLKKTFNDDLVNNDKYKFFYKLCAMENDEKLVLYFKPISKDSILNRLKNKKYISDKEYFGEFFWRYNRLKDTNIILKKDYDIFLKDIQVCIKYYEKMIILS